jgi:hypothetical protein
MLIVIDFILSLLLVHWKYCDNFTDIFLAKGIVLTLYVVLLFPFSIQIFECQIIFWHHVNSIVISLKIVVKKLETNGVHFEHAKNKHCHSAFWWKRSGIAVRLQKQLSKKSTVKAQTDGQMNDVIIQGACTEIVQGLYCAYNACVQRFYGALRFQHSVSTTISPC